MENTPTGCGSDLPTILRILKNDRKSRSVNNSLQPLDLDPNIIKDCFYQPKLRPVTGLFTELLCGTFYVFSPMAAEYATGMGAINIFIIEIGGTHAIPPLPQDSRAGLNGIRSGTFC